MKLKMIYQLLHDIHGQYIIVIKNWNGMIHLIDFRKTPSVIIQIKRW